ncbi:hypothetical protein BHM03_00024734 [Ensete ventricosum]|nr:hypothetical protein BHM03_00024734 [Ensete ventricosum]
MDYQKGSKRSAEAADLISSSAAGVGKLVVAGPLLPSAQNEVLQLHLRHRKGHEPLAASLDLPSYPYPMGCSSHSDLLSSLHPRISCLM